MLYSEEERDYILDDTEYCNTTLSSSTDNNPFEIFNGIPFAKEHGRYYPQIQELNTSSLVCNYVYSYKELCEVLRQPIKSGASKKRQLQEFERFFNYTKSGTKFIINEIYNVPLPYLPNIVSNSKYINQLTDVILDYLSESPQSVIYTSVSDLSYICGLRNRNYNTIKSYNMERLVKEYNASKSLIELCFFRSYSYHKKIICSLLKSLMSKGIINSYITYQIFQKTDNENRFIIREATNYDVQRILYIEETVLNKINVTKNQIWLNEETKNNYFTMLDNAIKELEPSWLTYKSVIKIEIPDWVFSKERVNISSNKKDVNQAVYHYLCEKVEENYKHKIEYSARGSNLEPNISESIPQQVHNILASIILLE